VWTAADIPIVPPSPTDHTGDYLGFAGVVLVAFIGFLGILAQRRKPDQASTPDAAIEPVQQSHRERLAVVESKLTGVSEALEDAEEALDLVDRRQAKSEHVLEDLKPVVQRLAIQFEQLSRAVDRLNEEHDQP
jgi:hypothetical protein